ncbi:MAG TPA: response regulator [Actinomycetota bacterium]
MARILIVDDDPSIRSMLRLKFELDGHAVAEAGDAQSAVSIYDETGPDLVLLDLGLHGKSGAWTLRQLRYRGPTPVLVMTGYEAADVLDEVKALGASGFIPKPFDPDELDLAVESALGRARRISLV